MIDSHCHLNDPQFEADLEPVIVRAKQSGVNRVVIIGYDLPSSARGIEIAQTPRSAERPELHAVVGVSPHAASSWDHETRSRLMELVGAERVVGVGETGLDYYYPDPPRGDQERALVEQIALANQAGLPVVFHLREAADDFFRVLDRENHRSGGVLHCFTGDERAMKMGVERGLFISFSGIVTFKKAEELREVARKTPIERLLVETDAPYLAPAPHRGKRCEPCHVVEVARCISELRGIDYPEFERRMEENLLKVFPRISEKVPASP